MTVWNLLFIFQVINVGDWWFLVCKSLSCLMCIKLSFWIDSDLMHLYLISAHMCVCAQKRACKKRGVGGEIKQRKIACVHLYECDCILCAYICMCGYVKNLHRIHLMCHFVSKNFLFRVLFVIIRNVQICCLNYQHLWQFLQFLHRADRKGNYERSDCNYLQSYKTHSGDSIVVTRHLFIWQL